MDDHRQRPLWPERTPTTTASMVRGLVVQMAAQDAMEDDRRRGTIMTTDRQTERPTGQPINYVADWRDRPTSSLTGGRRPRRSPTPMSDNVADLLVEESSRMRPSAPSRQ